jgi:hydroxyacylglutathione hydrolase
MNCDSLSGMARSMPLEDELGDVLEKALRHAGLTVTQLADATGVPAAKILDAHDYRYDELSCAELQKIAAALGLNEVGVCALGENRYPLPEMPPLPFTLVPVALPYGVGRVNAYFAQSRAGAPAVVFDTGNSAPRLRENWPAEVTEVAAVFVTHWESDHCAGLSAAIERQAIAPIIYGPPGGTVPAQVLDEADTVEIAGFRVRTYRTPGHAEAHHAYRLCPLAQPGAPEVLFSGDLVFAGSLGGGYYNCRELLRQARRVLNDVPHPTIVAPGHGPLTTAIHELRFNPFLS